MSHNEIQYCIMVQEIGSSHIDLGSRLALLPTGGLNYFSPIFHFSSLK